MGEMDHDAPSRLMDISIYGLNSTKDMVWTISISQDKASRSNSAVIAFLVWDLNIFYFQIPESLSQRKFRGYIPSLLQDVDEVIRSEFLNRSVTHLNEI